MSELTKTLRSAHYHDNGRCKYLKMDFSHLYLTEKTFPLMGEKEFEEFCKKRKKRLNL